MKSYADLQQSKKLAEILPLESADMYWSRCTITDFSDGELKVSYAVEPCNISQTKYTKEDVPCWSLAALLNVIELTALFKTPMGWVCKTYMGQKVIDLNIYYDEALDACYEMILKLHELNLL